MSLDLIAFQTAAATAKPHAIRFVFKDTIQKITSSLQIFDATILKLKQDLDFVFCPSVSEVISQRRYSTSKGK